MRRRSVPFVLLVAVLIASLLPALAAAAQSNKHNLGDVPPACTTPYMVQPNGQFPTSYGVPGCLFPNNQGIQINGAVVTDESTGLRRLQVDVTLDDPDPNGHPGKFFPFGFFTFRIAGVPLGQIADATLVVPSFPPVRAWWKQAPPEPSAPSSLWNFVHDLASGTGTFIITRDLPPYGETQQIHLSIADGGRGDEDFIANGSVRDPGAPSVSGDDDSFESVACRLDSFRCYQAKPSAGFPKFVPVRGVRANGTFDDVLVEVKKPLQLCVPADTTAGGVTDPETHLEAYAIKVQKGHITLPQVADLPGACRFRQTPGGRSWSSGQSCFVDGTHSSRRPKISNSSGPN